MLNPNNTLMALAARLGIKYPTLHRRYKVLKIKPEQIVGKTIFISDADVARLEQYNRVPGSHVKTDAPKYNDVVESEFDAAVRH